MAAYHEDIVECLITVAETIRSLSIRIAQLENDKPLDINPILKTYREDLKVVYGKLKTMKIEEIVDDSKYRKITINEAGPTA
jgi:hypothetical protein